MNYISHINKSIHFWVSLLVFSLLILAMTHFTGETVILVPGRYYRLFLECFSLSILVLYLTHPKVSKRIIFLRFPLICFFMLFLVFLLRFPNDQEYFTNSFKFIVSTFLMFAFFFAIACRRWNNKDLKMISYGAFILISLTFIKWILDGMPLTNYDAYGINPNGVGFLVLMICCALTIGFLPGRSIGRIWFIIAITMSTILLYVTSSRAAILCGVILTIFYWIWPKISQIRNHLLIVGVFIFFICNIFPYIYLYLFEVGVDLENIIVFSKALSSRYKEWYIPLNFFMEKPFWGWGIHAEVRTIGEGVFQTAHNSYIELAIRTGIIGILSYLIFFLSILCLLWEGRRDMICRFCGAFLISVMVYQVFERIMIVATDVDSLIIYFILGIGLSRVRDLKYQQSLSSFSAFIEGKNIGIKRAHTNLA